MPAVSSPVHAWSLSGSLATAAEGARIDLDVPGRGLVLPCGDSLLGVDLRTACQAGERWVRGDDLIAIYEPADARRLRTTALWRPLVASRPIVAWELTLSAQTEISESDAALAVTCDVACHELRFSRDPAAAGWTICGRGDSVPEDVTSLLLSRSGRQPAGTILVTVHPADRRRFVVRRTSGRIAIECWLFSAAIEKGVLLRGRVLAAVGPADLDEAWAGGLVSGFEAAPPPLTA